ncbi:MAG TPA: isoprenylcysteine carboxylmethyltransferase family protein [Stellaceae bacterium]|jgi:protein-S-isoprenylcysteine O-methyltransferase Ste14|nr:isoprenylcysteine carboxylmethyltransferase family protein [Stellaceae bacterium]
MRIAAEPSLYVTAALWAIWIVVWLAAAFGAKPTRWREPLGAAVLNRAPVLAGAVMLFAPQFLPVALRHRFISGSEAPVIGMVLVAAGLWFAIWARWHLGRNWSGTVTVKEHHALIVDGPYRWVRHPIYTGMLAALLGTALVIGAPYGFIGTALILTGFVVKLRVEEARMRETFPGDYERYSARTARLVPGIF